MWEVRPSQFQINHSKDKANPVQVQMAMYAKIFLTYVRNYLHAVSLVCPQMELF